MRRQRVQFTQVKLTGFKSFVDPTELQILPGTTGVVGPNGCGKSNLVEALRWVMGETSAKQMRGGEMDDVIFGGTRDRPARNLAEVALTLDNRDRSAPPAYNDSEALEVVRRIERGAGSQYRVNGKETRARDVQILFADAATGARSTAMVGQGQIGAIINAKPTDRRHLLEEAAGITGLHGRRHEAELRLRAAETNLERLDDVLQALQGQMQGLKRQARQAARYRSLSGRIRRAEAMLHYRRWHAAEAAVAEARVAVEQAAALVAGRTGEAAAAATAQADRAGAMPSLRQAEAEASAALHRLAVERDRLQEEEQRAATALYELDQQVAQISADLDREKASEAEARETAAALTREAAELERLDAETEATIAAAAAAAVEAAASVDVAEQEVARLTEALAARQAEQAAVAGRLRDFENRLSKLLADQARLADEHAGLADESDEERRLRESDTAVATAIATLEQAQAALSAAENRQQDAESVQDQAAGRERVAIDKLRDARSARDRLESEIAALKEAVESDDPADGRADGSGAAAGTAPDRARVIDAITVQDGFEMALEAALGDDLFAGTEPDLPSSWHHVDTESAPPPLPAPAVPLARVITAPAVLQRRLNQVGLVDGSEGPRLQTQLHQGQRLVSRDGALWRWDGFRRRADAPGGAAVRLRQRNRLTELSSRLPQAAAKLAEGEAAAMAAQKAHQEAMQARSAARQAVMTARGDAERAARALEAARERNARAQKDGQERRTRRAALGETLDRIKGEIDDVGQAKADAESALAALPAPDDLSEPLERARARLAAARTAYQARQADQARLAAESTARRERRAAIESERGRWLRRADDTRQHGEALAKRAADMAQRREALAGEPARLAKLRDSLGERMQTAEADRQSAADALAEAEQALSAAERTLKEANAGLAEAREEKVRVDGRLDQAVSVRDLEAEQIRERLNCEPPQALDLAEVDDADALPDLATIEHQLERLLRERDSMGAVNLRADEEAQELTRQIETLESERDDLLGAIARLRAGIGSLNREARQRLLDAFNRVNSHFEELFVRLFGGGHAHLKLSGSDDPLEAGLEVMASPPGKSLQSLSLLSGGEKALAALSLLFAVFLTKPAPICVLDEVDAPLDDANVDRFCNLLDEMTKSSGTRFLVVTHHRLTMARMDRLFGVTMTERGVSRLVSVDLGQGPQLQAAE